AAGVIVAGGYAALRPGTNAEVERIDFGAVRTPTEPAYVAELKPASDARIKEFRIPITHERIEIAPGVIYEGWTFGGTVPGPVMRVKQGDLVRVTLVNESPMAHSIDALSPNAWDTQREAVRVCSRRNSAGDFIPSAECGATSL